MAAAVSDPVREFEHKHEHLTGLALEAGRLLRAAPSEQMGQDSLRRLRACLKSLRDELLRHFAVERRASFHSFAPAFRPRWGRWRSWPWPTTRSAGPWSGCRTQPKPS